MFKSILVLTESLKNKPVEVHQENNVLTITNKTTNHTIDLKIMSNKVVNIKAHDLASLEELPSLTPDHHLIETIKLVNKISRINFLNEKDLIRVSNDGQHFKIVNTITNTDLSYPIVNGQISMPINEYKAIRNPKFINETGSPITLQEFMKNKKANTQKVVKEKIVEKSRFITVDSLTKKITRLNEQNEQTLITIHNRRKDFIKITNAITEPPDVFRLKIIKLDEQDAVEIPIENFRNIRNPKHFDDQGNEITLAQYLKSKPKKQRKPRAKKIKITTVEPVERITVDIPKFVYLNMNIHNLYLKIKRINRLKPNANVVFDYDKTKQIVTITNGFDNTKYMLPVVEGYTIMPKIAYDALKIPK